MEQAALEGLAPHGRDLAWSSSGRNAAPKIHFAGVHGGLSPVGDQRKSQKRKEVTDTTCNGLIKILFPIPPQCWGGGGGELRRKVKPSKKKSMWGEGGEGAEKGKGVSNFSYISHYSTLI